MHARAGNSSIACADARCVRACTGLGAVATLAVTRAVAGAAGSALAQKTDDDSAA
jgi:hypothetical protein